MTNNWIGMSDFLVWSLALIFISIGLAKRFTPMAGAAFLWISFSSLLVFQNSLNLLPFDPILRLYNSAAESALISLLLTLVAICSLSLNFWDTFFSLLLILNTILILGQFAFHPHDTPMGILMNGSMSGCLSASILPLINKRKRWARAIVFLSVIACGRSLPLLVMFSGMAAELFVLKKYAKITWMVPVGIGIGFLLKGKMFLDSSGRTDIWRATFYYFKEHCMIWQGAGLGSFYILGQSISNGVFIWLHSDWAQILFETGVLGLLLISIMYFDALYKSKKLPQLFGALVAFAVYGLANMPLRYPLAGLYGAYLMRCALQRSNRS